MSRGPASWWKCPGFLFACKDHSTIRKNKRVTGVKTFFFWRSPEKSRKSTTVPVLCLKNMVILVTDHHSYLSCSSILFCRLGSINQSILGSINVLGSINLGSINVLQLTKCKQTVPNLKESISNL